MSLRVSPRAPATQMMDSPLSFARVLASSDVTVDFDPTFLAQLLLFTTFVVVLRPLLFDPLLRVFEERERRTVGAKREARDMDQKAAELLKEYETRLEKVRSEARIEREKQRGEIANGLDVSVDRERHPPGLLGDREADRVGLLADAEGGPVPRPERARDLQVARERQEAAGRDQAAALDEHGAVVER